MGFSEARERQQDAVFARLGEAAQWSGRADPVRVRFAEQDEIAGFGDGSRLIMGSLVLKVRRSQIASPAIGDEAELSKSGRQFRVTSDPWLDRKGVWLCPVEELF